MGTSTGPRHWAVNRAMGGRGGGHGLPRVGRENEHGEEFCVDVHVHPSTHRMFFWPRLAPAFAVHPLSFVKPQSKTQDKRDSVHSLVFLRRIAVGTKRSTLLPPRGGTPHAGGPRGVGSGAISDATLPCHLGPLVTPMFVLPRWEPALGCRPSPALTRLPLVCQRSALRGEKTDVEPGRRRPREQLSQTG